MSEFQRTPPKLLSELFSSDRLDALGVTLDSTALTDGTTSLSWTESIDEIGRLTAVLRAASVGRGDRVAVRLPKSVASFVAVHAVIRAGGVMVPVDPQAPAAHARTVVGDSGAAVMITDARPASLAIAVECVGVSTIVTPTQRVDAEVNSVLRSDQVLIDADGVNASTPGAAAEAEPSDDAYIIYTSGSTGRPKGIVHTHASALAYATSASRTYDLVSADRFANIAPLHFDQSTFELYSAPLVGAAVLVVPDPVLRFPASLSELISREAITVWYSVPYLLGQLSTRGVLDERDLSSLRWVLFGGEAFPPGQLAALMEQLPSARFSNVYGPAEVNQCTVFNLDEPPADGEPVPIGVAWDAADLLIVDPNDIETAMATGQPGVLLVSSPTMMDRYWGRSDLTDAAISTRSGPDGRTMRWYRTGDLVVERDDGNIEFLGRVDNQIKFRGHRIELEAIDLVLGDIAEVDAATVVVERLEGSDDRLVALVTAVSGSVDHFDLVELIGRTLRSRLPRYAVPSDVRVVESLPRTATGKVDRNASLQLLW